jgi:hypothetical protein
MAGTLTITTLSDGTNSTSATNCIQGSAKAWVNFNGVTTATIRASYNVSSVTRTGTGLYTVAFTNALTDASYATVTGVNKYDATRNADTAITTGTSTLLQTSTNAYIAVGWTGTSQDVTQVSVACFR